MSVAWREWRDVCAKCGRKFSGTPSPTCPLCLPAPAELGPNPRSGKPPRVPLRPKPGEDPYLFELFASDDGD